MPTQDKKFMRLAIEKAREGIQKGQTPFGACIVKGNKVMACVYNIVWKSSDITAHAEINAIRAACRKLGSINLSGCTIYSTCEPCPMCFSACHWARVKRIVYGSNIQDARRFGFHELHISGRRMKRLGKSPLRITADFMRRENLELFKIWSQRPGKKIY